VTGRLLCARCGRDVAPGEQGCGTCGPDLVCGSCGRPVPPAAASCPWCSLREQEPVRSLREQVPIADFSGWEGRHEGGPPSPRSTEIARAIPAPRHGEVQPLRGGSVLPPLRVDMPPPVPEVYQHGRHGVRAEVSHQGADAQIMTEQLGVAQVMLAFATRMNSYVGHLQLTRDNIKALRRLAADLQEEVEIRRGPQG